MRVYIWPQASNSNDRSRGRVFNDPHKATKILKELVHTAKSTNTIVTHMAQESSLITAFSSSWPHFSSILSHNDLS